ncbi:MAG: hypothetical protein IJ498_01455 [Akkermansia sp.]|nr:hypothetical protein [Akkermansia sp.]
MAHNSKKKFIGWSSFETYKAFYLFWIPIYKKTSLKSILSAIKGMRAELDSVTKKMGHPGLSSPSANVLEAIKEINWQLETIKEVSLPALIHHPTVFPKYKGLHKGQDLVLVGAGPTLDQYTPIPGAFHIGVNRVFQATHVPLDYLFIADGGTIESQQLLDYRKNECVKFFGRHRVYPIMETFADDCKAERFFIDPLRPGATHNNIFKDLAHQPFVYCYSIIIAAFQFALWCQPKRLYVVGCDAANNGYFSGDTRDTKQWLNENIIKEWHTVAEFAKKHYPDIEIISINPVGLKGLFKDATMTNGIIELSSK